MLNLNAQQRYAAGVEYLGSHYHGWQKQAQVDSIQARLEQALSQVANHTIDTVCAGRTDAGVHALGQVIHFDSYAPRSNHSWLHGTNSYLPHDISLQWVKSVNKDFHARFSAKSRCYHYHLYCHPARPAIRYQKVTWYRYGQLNLTAMQQAAQYLIGEHDFSSFRAKDCQSKTPIRCLHSLNIRQQGNLIRFELCANTFLHHMVRNIIGTLLQIGENKQAITWMQSVLHAKRRDAAGVTAPPEGLYLVEVSY